MRTSLSVATAALLVGGALAAFAAPANAVGAAEVDWSGVPTAFNPDTTTVTVTADYTGDETLMYRWGFAWRPLNPTGETTLVFDTDGHGDVDVYTCPTGIEPSEQTCTLTGDNSPILDVRRELLLGSTVGGPTPRGRVVSGGLFMRPKVNDTAIPATWHLRRNPGGPDVFSGPATITSLNGSTRYTAHLPANVRGNFYFQVTVEDYEVAPYGPLDGATDEESVFIEDLRAVPDVDIDTLFPVKDGYLDTSTINVTAPETVTGTLEVRDETGLRVKMLREGSFAAGISRVRWDGTRTDGSLVPEGTYSVVMTATDAEGNEGVRHDLVTVSHQRLVTRTFKRSMDGIDAYQQVESGACSSLAQPSRRAWSPILRYESNITCNGRNTPRSRLITTGHLDLPPVFQNRYRSVRLEILGGATRQRGHRIKDALRGRFVAEDGSLLEATRFGPRKTTHRSTWAPAALAVQHRLTSPQVVWTLAATPSSRYDVRTVSIVVTYDVLGS